ARSAARDRARAARRGADLRRTRCCRPPVVAAFAPRAVRQGGGESGSNRVRHHGDGSRRRYVGTRDRDATSRDGCEVAARLSEILAPGRPPLGPGPPAVARSCGARASLTAIGLACLSAFLFGAMSVGLRMGLD